MKFPFSKATDGTGTWINHRQKEDSKTRSLSLHFLLAILFFPILLQAEGTKQLDPAATDLTYLMTNNASYGSFATYNGSESTRLFIHISDPATEQVYIGVDRALYFNGTNDALTNYYFRIKDPTGNIVYGPYLVDASTANLTSWAQANAGPAPIVGGSGYTPIVFDPVGLSAGDYYIEFSNNSGAVATANLDILHWDITVATKGGSPAAIDGRVWAYNWAFKTPTIDGSGTYGGFDRPFNGVLYTYTSEGFVTKVDFGNSGFRGWFFTVAFNSTGTANSGNVNEDRKSVANSNSTYTEHKIFLNDPDISVYPSGTIGTFTADPLVNACDPNDPCIWVETSKVGQVEILLDFDQTSGVGIYDPGTSDVLLAGIIDAAPGETAPFRKCIEWDGLDGLGNPADLNNNVYAKSYFGQGLTHYASYDVEYVIDGYSVETVRPTPQSGYVMELYYDDTNIPFASGTAEPNYNYEGCNMPCHKWSNLDYGNLNTINTWWYGNLDTRSNLHIPFCSPVAWEDTAGTALNQPVVIAVFDNDQGNNLDTSSVSVTTQPANGSVSVNSTTGQITYTPNPGFTGSDLFWYEICNQDAPPICDDASVFISINGITAINDDNNSLVNEGVSGNVLTNDVDNEGDNISLNLTPFADPAHGSVVLQIDGSYTYTPSTDYVGQDQFKYIICDDAVAMACDTATVFITITDEPSFANNEVIANADEVITNVDVAVTANVLSNDADVDGDNLTVNTTPTSNSVNGVVSLAANGDFTYTPNAGFAGQDQFSYEVCDDGVPQRCAETIVVIDVIPDLNGSDPNAPFAGDDFNLTNINTAVNGDLSTNDSGNGTINTTPLSGPANGIVSINPDGTYTYTPTNGYTGADQFSYQTCAGIGSTITEFASTDIPVTIVDQTTVSSSLTIPSGAEILDINLKGLKITHTYIGDISITLKSPLGTSAVIIANVCGSSDNYDVTFDDEGAALSVCSDLVSGGNFQPFNDPLSTFDGENSTGTWTLEINDNASGDNGTLDTWSLEIETNSSVCSNATAYLLVMPPPVTDLDEDNDGIPDLQEVFSGDHDNDGTPDYADPDFCAATFEGVNGWDCSNGLPDPDFDLDGDGTPNFSDPDYPYTIPDSDGDGFYDHLDIDVDNDGIPDLIEMGGTDINGDGLVDVLTDSDNDGLVDLYDPANALNPGTNEGMALVDVDSDGDGVLDYLDIDADNDGIPDLVEWGGTDVDGDGRVDNLTDSDGDGFVNLYDPSNESNPGNNEGTPHLMTGADSGDGTPVSLCSSSCSFDGDDLPPHLDLDSDNDGIPDLVEVGGIDIDGNGRIDDLTDSDGDGFSDAVDPSDDGPASGTGNTGTPYVATNGSGTLLNGVAGNSFDNDADGLSNYLDLDADNDGIPDLVEAGGIDINGDGRVDNSTDTDADGLADIYDEAASDGPGMSGTNGIALVETDGSGNMVDGLTANSVDTDGDGIPNHLDLDADNDGIADIVEAGGLDEYGLGMVDTGAAPWDSDGDGLADVYDQNNNDGPGPGGADGTALIITTADTNNDGHAQATLGEVMTGGGTNRVNMDGDIVPNHLDLDADNDGIVDLIEIGLSDLNGDGMVDGLPGNDADGWLDVMSGVIITTADSGDSNPYPDYETGTSKPDFDGDGLPNYLDIDADNDGIVDNTEGQSTSGYIAPTVDSDSDGLNDAYESVGTIGSFGGVGISPVNSDGTDAVDIWDLDADNDAEPDSVEGHDSDNDGVGDMGSNANLGVSTGSDTDFDGLDDGYDNNTSSTDATNSALNPNLHPDAPDSGAGDRDWRATNRNIAGLAWHDVNEDGILDDGETRLSGVVVTIFDSGDNQVTQVSTQADGSYLVSDLPEDTYYVVFTKPAAYGNYSPQNIGGDNADSDAATTNGQTGDYIINTGTAEIYTSAGFFGAPLPVELVEFGAKSESCSARIYWKTASQKNADRFELERSLDGIEFEKIAHINISEGSGWQAYQYLDEEIPGLIYYRLKIVDLDETYVYSEIIAVESDCKELENESILLFPNPVYLGNETLSLQFSADGQAKTIFVNDYTGKTVKSFTVTTESGLNYQQINISGLPCGVYNLVFQPFDKLMNQRFVIVK